MHNDTLKDLDVRWNSLNLEGVLAILEAAEGKTAVNLRVECNKVRTCMELAS